MAAAEGVVVVVAAAVLVADESAELVAAVVDVFVAADIVDALSAVIFLFAGLLEEELPSFAADAASPDLYDESLEEEAHKIPAVDIPETCDDQSLTV